MPGPVAAQALRTHRFRRAPLERLLLAPLPLAPVQMMVLASHPRSFESPYSGSRCPFSIQRVLSETCSTRQASNGRTSLVVLGRRLSADNLRSRPCRSDSQATCRNQPISSTRLRTRVALIGPAREAREAADLVEETGIEPASNPAKSGTCERFRCLRGASRAFALGPSLCRIPWVLASK